MIFLSNHGQENAKIQALRIMAGRENRTLADMSATKSDKEQAVLALMALNLAPSVLKAIGSPPLNPLLRRLRDNVHPAGEYRTFADMVARETDEALPMLHAQWTMWQAPITRFHLYEIADVNSWISPIARFDARGIRSPLCIRRIPFGELIKPGWESRILTCCYGCGGGQGGRVFFPTYPSAHGIRSGSGFPESDIPPPGGRYQADSDFNRL